MLRVYNTTKVVQRTILLITLSIRRHVRRRITPCIVSDALIAAGKIANLRFPRTIVAGEFMHKDDRNARSAVLIVEFHAVVGSQMRHRCPLCSSVTLVKSSTMVAGTRACQSKAILDGHKRVEA